ncbi:DUF6461 domain-containing protein [Streptomyces boluensis]|uniref:Uncharacterized protein n=1 Tax=Streptomyces boluensis TaxID=1775135 RepID=A0A964UKP7_9ACTN|nr:DUF6461 domain-containing protein [Streptomyces boluensis]NBE50884.1 hypothetical protein [Streptomyces boluensis]
MTGTTARDYTWVDDDDFGMTVAYCATLARGLTPEQLLDRVGAQEVTRGTGLDAVVWGEQLEAAEQLPFAVTAIGDWSLMYEHNGFVGVTDSVLARLSRDTVVVSHFKNVNAVDKFCWWENGAERLRFQPLFPSERNGPDAESMAATMRDVGFDLTDFSELDDDREDFGPVTLGAFALAERITGVRVTPEIITGAEFVGGRRPKKRRRH